MPSMQFPPIAILLKRNDKQTPMEIAIWNLIYVLFTSERKYNFVRAFVYLCVFNLRCFVACSNNKKNQITKRQTYITSHGEQ